jgi:hypothetical protein
MEPKYKVGQRVKLRVDWADWGMPFMGVAVSEGVIVGAHSAGARNAPIGTEAWYMIDLGGEDCDYCPEREIVEVLS